MEFSRGTVVRCRWGEGLVDVRYGVVRLDPSWTGATAIVWWLADQRAWFQGGMSMSETYEIVGLDEPGLPDEVLTCSVAYQLVDEPLTITY